MEQKVKRKPFSNYKALLKAEFCGYNFKWFLKDALCGISIGACILPLIFAISAQSVRADAVTFGVLGGLISCIVSNLIIAVIGGGVNNVSIPCYALSTVILSLTYTQYGAQSMFLACLLSGLLLFVCGITKAGNFVKRIPRPIVNGFTFGISLCIMVWSLPNVIGAQLDGSSNVAIIKNLFTTGIKNINYINVAVFSVTLILALIYPKKLENVVPSAIILTAVATAVVFVFKLDVITVNKVDFNLTNSIKFNIDKTTAVQFKSVIFPSLSIFAITLIQSAISGERASEITGQEYSASYQLTAQGLANIILPFLGGMPSSSTFESVALSVKTKSKTRITNLFVALSVLAFGFLLKDAITYIPLASSSAILIASIFKMNAYKTIKHYFKRKSWGAIALFIISAVLVFFLSLPLSLVIAMTVALLIMLYNMRDVEVYAELKKDLKTVGVNVTGPLHFGSCEDFVNKIKSINCEYDRLIIDFSGVTYVDSTALQKTLDYLEILNETKVITFCGTRIKVLKAIAVDGFYQSFGAENFFNTFNDAYRAKYKKREISVKQKQPVETPVKEEREVAVTEKKYEEQTVKADNETITKVIPPQE